MNPVAMWCGRAEELVPRGFEVLDDLTYGCRCGSDCIRCSGSESMFYIPSVSSTGHLSPPERDILAGWTIVVIPVYF